MCNYGILLVGKSDAKRMGGIAGTFTLMLIFYFRNFSKSYLENLLIPATEFKLFKRGMLLTYSFYVIYFKTFFGTIIALL